MKRWQIYLLAFLATLLAVFWQELNLFYLDGNLPSKNGLLTSADEASYFGPAKHFLETGVWKNSGSSISSFFIRTPGYGIVYLICLLIANSKAFLLLKAIQILFFFTSIIYAEKILNLTVQRQKIKKIALFLYAFLPCFSGFMYFTLTESMTSLLVLQTVYFALKLQEDASRKNGFYFIGSNAVLILFRPQLILISVCFIGYQLLLKKWKIAFYICISFIPLIIWNVRTTVISKQYLGIHPIYAYQNNSVFRPSHEKLTDIYRIWEHDGSKFHQTVALLGDTSLKDAVTQSLALVPNKYQRDVKLILVEYRTILLYQQKQFPNDKAIKGIFRGERNFEEKIVALRSELIKANKLDYFVLTPLKSFKALLISSHLNLAIFQNFWRGNILIEILRWICVLLLVFSWLSLPPALFFSKNGQLLWLQLALLITLFYLGFVQRMNEERYLTPFLPIVLILAAGFVDWFFTSFLRSRSL